LPEGWEWDETLFEGSAPFYVRGRFPYAPELAPRLAAALDLDGSGRLLDVGCGPGVLSLALAHLFKEAIGVDPDAGMLEEAKRRAAEAGIENARWVRLRAEELPAGLGAFRAATFGQSFHWMDRDRVAATVRAMLEPGGAFVHVAEVKDPRPPVVVSGGEPPYEEIRDLVGQYCGPIRRAGQGLLRHGSPDGEESVLRAAGFGDPQRLRINNEISLGRSTDDIVAWVYSQSGSAPHLFGERRLDFEHDLRRLLNSNAAKVAFVETPPDTEVLIWCMPN